MGSPRSIRFDESVLVRLASYARSRPGITLSSAANALVDEALRAEEHPGIVFRDGPAGRRPGLAGGPDVAEVIGALHAIRAERPGLTGDGLLTELMEVTGLDADKVRAAIRYYAVYEADIDAWITANDEAAARAEEAWSAQRRILGEAS